MGSVSLMTGMIKTPLYEGIKRDLGHVGYRCDVECTSKKFSNQNIKFRIDDCIRGTDLYIFQPMYPNLDERVLELFIMIDAAKHASVGRITVVLPYFPYVRSDKKDDSRISITARLMADLIQVSGADRIMTMHLHSPQVQGFFRVPVDHLYPGKYVCEILQANGVDKNHVVVAPDMGASKMGSYYSEKLNTSLVIINKKRIDDTENPHVQCVIGDVKGKSCILVDDETLSGKSLVKAAMKLKEEGAEHVDAFVVHGVFSDDAAEVLNNAPINQIFTTNTITRPDHKMPDRLQVIDMSSIFSQAIQCTHENKSMKEFFGRSNL
jgi:ribose-phosphate pyrophosphokinase